MNVHLPADVQAKLRRLRPPPALRAAIVIYLLAPLASPSWSVGTKKVTDWLLRPKPLAIVAALGLLALALPISIPFVALASAPLVVLVILTARLFYPRTVRGRLRVRYGSQGWATWWDLHRHASAIATRSIASATKPAAGSDGAGGPEAPVSAGTWLGRTAVGPTLGVECYAPHRDVVGLVAPPQTGKTGLLGHHVLDHDGPVVSTSTKPDVHAYTAGLRASKARSGRVSVFNPEGMAGVASTFRWSPVSGCQHPRVAAERAAAMVGATAAAGGEDRSFWLDSAAKVLRCYLMAAALDGRSMADVATWVTLATDRAGEALALLEQVHVHRVPDGWAAELRQVLDTGARRTRESIFLTLSQTVAFMSDPDVAVACLPDAHDPVFDVEDFLADQGTLYLLGSQRAHESVAPLLAALTTHVFESAKRIATHRPGGRLDPSLMLALDEAALITPVPLDRWVADAGGRGIHLVWAVQSPSQLAQRWGREGANTIWNGTNIKLVYGGLTLDQDLDAISRLCGERHDDVPDPRWGRRYERMRILPVDRLRTLPVRHALLLHRAMPPTIVRLVMVWERVDVARGALPSASPARPSLWRDVDPPTAPIQLFSTASGS